MASSTHIHVTKSYGCNGCDGHRDKQQEHSHSQNVTFVTTLKETTHLRKVTFVTTQRKSNHLVSLGFPGSISGQCGVKRGLKTTSIDLDHFHSI